MKKEFCNSFLKLQKTSSATNVRKCNKCEFPMESVFDTVWNIENSKT